MIELLMNRELNLSFPEVKAMNAQHAVECTECGEFSRTVRPSHSGPVCERCHEWNLQAARLMGETSREIRAEAQWRDPAPAEQGEIFVGQP